MRQPIIAPVPVELLKSELTPEHFLRHTNKAGNDIYVVDAVCAPNVMREIGRLREIAFRAEGGGTGQEADIDRFDTMENPCKQLVLWNPDTEEIIGGYRFMLGPDIKYDPDGQPVLATSHLFRFSQKFIDDYLPYTLELGRSYVRLEYQSSHAGAKSLYALDNIWDGLGALTVKYPYLKYFFGKVTMYPSFEPHARDMILCFLSHHFSDKEQLVTPIRPLSFHDYNVLFPHDNIKDNHKILNTVVRALGQNIPPLINAYMNLSNSMKVFGSAINDDFGNVEETGILITVDDIYADKRNRHIDTYLKSLNEGLSVDKFGFM
ncbi:MAG: GNAT family N-acetyltransferase [Candidatus Aphodosoma sp.]